MFSTFWNVGAHISSFVCWIPDFQVCTVRKFGSSTPAPVGPHSKQRSKSFGSAILSISKTGSWHTDQQSTSFNSTKNLFSISDVSRIGPAYFNFSSGCCASLGPGPWAWSTSIVSKMLLLLGAQGCWWSDTAAVAAELCRPAAPARTYRTALMMIICHL